MLHEGASYSASVVVLARSGCLIHRVGMYLMAKGIEGEDTTPCNHCVEVYGESRNYGGSHWHCANCLEVSSYQGHFGLLPDGSWGFSCPKKGIA